ncbi:MAG TPA: hypothetical protein VMD78_01180, partial [Candidatus Baltobacteraceae bacterium]|nr:hypothetical protein [Candidatus Baltobacteraceae bacterium]
MSKKLRKFQRPPEPREEHVNAADVVAHLAELSKAASIREIAHGMGLKHRGRRYLPRVIEKLKKRGEVEEIYGGRYKLADQDASQKPTTKQPPAAPPARAHEAAPSEAAAHDAQAAAASRRARDPNLIAGRIIAHRDGYAFLVPDQPIPGVDGDLFIGRDSLGDAMHGDRVLGRIVRRRPDGRAEGRIVQIVRREHPTLVGLFRYGPHGNHVLPYDVRLHHEVLIPPGDELTADLRAKLGIGAQQPPANRRLRLPELDGAVVNVEITRFPRAGLAPMGRVIEILGRPGDIGVDVEIIIRKHHIPHEFPEDVVAAAKATAPQVSEYDLRGRRDFRDLPIVTIDGETAR